MKIIIASRLGFCFGVKRSIEIALQALNKEPKPVNFLGDIVHNRQVMAKFREQGINFINNLEEIKDGTLITKAHGVSQEILKQAKEKKLKIKDTTCPIVRIAQEKAQELNRENYKVIIIGEKNHPETRVIKEFAGDKALITEDEEEIKQIPYCPRIGAVAQTTKKRERVKELLELLKNRCDDFKWIDTICNEVADRQKELKNILKKVEGVVVVGSKESANTTRLAEIVQEAGKKLFWVDCLEELKQINIKNLGSVGLVSGTSAPNWEIEKIKNFLENEQN